MTNTENLLRIQSEPGISGKIFEAAKQLAESEIQLIKTISKSKRSKKMEKNIKKKNKMSDVRPSAALIAAKREAFQRQMSQKDKLKDTFVDDVYQKAITSYSLTRKDTGVVYDVSMADHKCLWDPHYPECPERFTRVLQRCKELNLLDRCKSIEPRFATNDEILTKHTQEQIDILKSTENCQDLVKLESISSKYDAIFIHPSTHKLSLLATGSTINLIENILKGEIQNGMAIIRPPGHHAMKSEYCGYCFFNNVAIAAEIALRENLANKILIVDWDVHHGQATQQMFYHDPRVVYFSIHRFEYGEFWPNLKESDYHYIGDGPGKGYNFNIPLNKIGMTNADYIAIFHQVLLPMAYEFQPELIIVSAGYDAALGCPEGQMEVTPACYSHLLSSLMSLAAGKIAVILEGGYCLKSLAESAALTLRTLLGDPCPLLNPLESPSASIRETILNAIYVHRPYWKCYQFQDFHTNDDPMPVVLFKGKEEKLEIYETRDCYPVQSNETIQMIEEKLNALIESTNLSKPANKVCLVYDERMLNHCDESDNTHPERPVRISHIMNKLKENSLLERCHLKAGRPATLEELLLVHDKNYIEMMHNTKTLKPHEFVKQAKQFTSVYLHLESWDSSCVAVGSLLTVVDDVLNGQSQSGVAIIRPPGHHANNDEACGFCIFNNVSIAAKYSIKSHHLKRVMIVDWDVHHGNGIQSIFENDPQVLYISIHRYDDGNFFPESKNGNYNVVGFGAGEGFNVNIPWNEKGMGNAEYISAFQQIIMPIAYNFNPELVFVSAGFDACIGDPLGGCLVTPELYGHLTHWLSSLANGRIILALEGGYNVHSISHSMTMCVKSLLGDPLPILNAGQSPCASAVKSIKNVIRTQKQYWPNLMFDLSLSESRLLFETKKENEGEKLTDMMMNLSTKLAITKCVDNQSQEQKAGSSDGSGRSRDNDDQRENANGREAGDGLFNYLSDNLEALVTGQMFAIIPLRDCPHLDRIENLPSGGIDVNSPCVQCNTAIENWICLHCYTVHCARNINQHALSHYEEVEHQITLSFTDLSVWCYGCEAYIDNPRLYAARNAAHLSKFNEELPWTYDDPPNQ